LEIDRVDRAAVARCLAEISILDRAETLPYLKRLLESEATDGFGWNLARTRVLLGGGEHGAAGDLLRDLVDSPELPFRFRHRVRLLLARCMFEQGDVRPAQRVLLEAVEECPADPDAVETLMERVGGAWSVEGNRGEEVQVAELLSKIAPDYRVGMTFLGGAAELTGFDLKQGTGRGRASTLLRVFWRFWTTLPSDLAVTVASKNARGQTVYLRRRMFGEATPREFAAGYPQIGRTIVVDLPLSWKARTGRDLAIGLQKASDREWLRSVEGLPYVEIRDWSTCARDGRGESREEEGKIPVTGRPLTVQSAVFLPRRRCVSGVEHGESVAGFSAVSAAP